MFFTVPNKRYLSTNQLHANALIKAYYTIKEYPLLASEKILDDYIQQQYRCSLKNMCVDLLLNSTFYVDDSKNLIILFKNAEHDKIARLITYGNGAIQGSRILTTALNS